MWALGEAFAGQKGKVLGFKNSEPRPVVARFGESQWRGERSEIETRGEKTVRAQRARANGGGGGGGAPPRSY